MIANLIALSMTLIMFMSIDLYGAKLASQVEVWISPVVTFNPATDIFRDEIKVCWTENVTKRAEAKPIKYEFFVETRYSARMNLSAYLAEDDNKREPRAQLVNHKVGSSWGRRYCSELPGVIADSQEFIVSGYSVHQRHILWNTVTPLPAFTVPPLTSAP